MLSCTNCTGEPQVPVTVTPFAHAGKTVTKCCGKPKVVSDDKPCPGTKNGAVLLKSVRQYV